MTSSEPELPDLDPAEEQRLAEALRHAVAPQELDPARHERLLRAALEDPFAPPSSDELVESERLRRALDGQDDPSNNADLALARALAAAHAAKPAPLPELARDALRDPQREEPLAPRAARGGRVLYLRFGAAAATLAAAAAVVLSLGTRDKSAPAPDLQALALVQSRSTAALFQAAAAGAPSSRIDRIASVRERELRDNRYALWGIR